MESCYNAEFLIYNKINFLFNVSYLVLFYLFIYILYLKLTKKTYNKIFVYSYKIAMLE